MIKRLLFIFLIGTAFNTNAQFFNGIGLTAGITYCKQKYLFDNPESTYKTKYQLRYNGSVFAELFSHNTFRWITEIQYNQKGGKDNYTYADGSTATLRNKLDYICWNNYLKIRVELFSFTPYILIGPRLEYRFRQSIESPYVTGLFKTLHLSPAIGIGSELVTFGQIKPFLELIYNPDISNFTFTQGYKNIDIVGLNKPIELRIGIKFQFRKNDPDACPPVYTLN